MAWCPLESALGRHAQPWHGLVFAPEHRSIACGMSHMDLLSRPEVAQQLVRWLEAANGAWNALSVQSD